MQMIDYEEMARRLILNGAEAYKKKFMLEVDILSGYDRQRILEEMDKQIEEIKELSDKYTEKICKGVEEEILEEYRREIKELKEDRKKYAEEYIHNNPWLYKQLNENYILRVESEQRERGAYIKGTNDADELCNKKWEDKIKEKVIEIKNKPVKDEFITASQGKLDTIIEIESLLERK